MKINRALNILETDRKPTALLGLLHFLVAAGHSLFDIAATSLLVGHLGPDALPEVYMASAALLIVVGLFLIPIVDRWHRAGNFALVLVAFSLVLFAAPAFASDAPGVVYRALYVLAFLMKGLVFLQYWLLAGDVLDLRQAKRVFPILLGCSLLGGLASSAGASLVARWQSTTSLLTAAAVLLLIGLVPVYLVSGRFWPRGRRKSTRPPRAKDIARGLRRDIEVALESPLLRTLSSSLLLLALLAQVLDYLMGSAAHARFISDGGAVEVSALTTFYAILNTIVIGVGALLQFTVAHRIISSVGVTRGQLVGPITFLAAFSTTGIVWLAFASLVAPVFFFTVVASRALQKTLRISIVRTSSDLLFNAVPRERRGRAKAFKETVIEPVGVLLGGVFLTATETLRFPVVLGGALVLSVLFFVLSLRVKEHYLENLVSVLRERSRFRFALPSMMMRKVRTAESGGGVTVSGLRRALHDEEASVRLLAVEVAAELKEPEAASLLVTRYRRETDPEVRSGMLAALGKMLRRHQEQESDDATLEDLDPLVRASGMESLAQSAISLSEDIDVRGESEATHASDRSDALDVPGDSEAGGLDPGAAGVATAPLAGRGEEDENENENQNQNQNDPVKGAVTARRPLAARDESQSPAAAGDREPKLDAPPQEVRPRRRVFFELAESGERGALERLVHYMEQGDGATRHLAARALERCGEPAVDVLTLALWSADVEGRRFVIRALSRIGTARSKQALLPVLSLEAQEAYYDLVRLEALSRLPDDPSVHLLSDSLSHRVRRSKRNAHQILRSAFLAEPGMRLILSNLTHPDAYVRSSAIEALEVRVDAALLGGILPLFEHEDPRTIAEHGGSFFHLPDRSPLDVLSGLMRHRSPWVRACAVFAMGRVGKPDYARALERRLDDGFDLVRLNAVEALGALGDRESLELLDRLSTEPASASDDPEASERFRVYMQSATETLRARVG